MLDLLTKKYLSVEIDGGACSMYLWGFFIDMRMKRGIYLNFELFLYGIIIWVFISVFIGRIYFNI